jgi:uncharacterized membrane protein
VESVTSAAQPPPIEADVLWANPTDEETVAFIPPLLRHPLCAFFVRRWRSNVNFSMAVYNRQYAELAAAADEVKALPRDTVRSLLLPSAALEAWNRLSAEAANKLAGFAFLSFLLFAVVELALLSQPLPWKSAADVGSFVATGMGILLLAFTLMGLVAISVWLVSYIFAPVWLTQRVSVFCAIVCGLYIAFHYPASNSIFSEAVCTASIVFSFLFLGYPLAQEQRKRSLAIALTITGAFAIAIVFDMLAGRSGILVVNGVTLAVLSLALLVVIALLQSALITLRRRYYMRTYPQGLLVYSLLFSAAALQSTKGPVYSIAQIQVIAGVISTSAEIVERYLLGTTGIADVILRFNVEMALRCRAAKLREVAVTIAAPTDKLFEAAYNAILRSLVDSVRGQWGGLEPSTDAPLVSVDRKERILGAVRRGVVVALIVVAIYFLQTIRAPWMTDTFRAPATVALAVFAFQLILAQIDPTAAAASGDVIASVRLGADRLRT